MEERFRKRYKTVLDIELQKHDANQISIVMPKCPLQNGGSFLHRLLAQTDSGPLYTSKFETIVTRV